MIFGCFELPAFLYTYNKVMLQEAPLPPVKTSYGILRYTPYSLCKHVCTSSRLNFPCSLALSVMQLKKFFIANVGVTIVPVKTTAIAETALMIYRDRCVLIEFDDIVILILL